MERDLKQLVQNHPNIATEVEFDTFCPSRSVGSSNIDDYPRAIEDVARSLLAYAANPVRREIEPVHDQGDAQPSLFG